MKRLSIKLRVTMWFTLLMLLLVGVVLAFLFYVGERVVLTGSKETLAGVVADSFNEIEYDDGEIDIDDDLDYFRNGVYIAVYTEDGGLLYGRLPSGFNAEAPLSDGVTQTVAGSGDAWYVHDALHKIGPGPSVWVRGVMSSSGSDGAFGTMITLAAIALPFMVLLIALGGYAVINRAFRPVRQITDAAERIGDGKDLSARIALGKGRDEIYTLAATFDGMFDRLQASFERERQFTSDASHELRTPTAVIISQCEYALDSAETLDEAKEALGTVLRQAERMSALIAQLLTLARGDAGHAKLQMELINMSELTELAAAQVGERAAEKHIALRTDIQPELLLRGDETMLVRLLLNLMENGVKYGREGGTLDVRLYGRDGNVVGEVVDDGEGIAPEELPKIWERFYQSDAARSAGNEGAGLGLPMVKYIAEAHGGGVSAESAPGRGSKFTFILPAEEK